MSEELKELRNLRKLLILLLIQNDVKVNDIAKALGVDASRVSHWLNPKGEKGAKEESQGS